SSLDCNAPLGKAQQGRRPASAISSGLVREEQPGLAAQRPAQTGTVRGEEQADTPLVATFADLGASRRDYGCERCRGRAAGSNPSPWPPPSPPAPPASGAGIDRG